MADFVAIPVTVVPFSSKNEGEGIEWAKSYVDQVQQTYPSGTYVTGMYNNLKINQSGQILSTVYGELVKNAFGLNSVERVFLSKIMTYDQFLQEKGVTEDQARELIQEYLDNDTLSIAEKQEVKDIIIEHEFSDEFIDSVAEKISPNVEIPTKQEIIQEAVLLANSGFDNEEIKDAIIQFKSANLPIEISDILTEVNSSLADQLKDELDLTQAQNDVVKGAIDFLTTGGKLDDLVESTHIGAFRAALTNLATQNASLVAAFDNAQRLELNIINE